MIHLDFLASPTFGIESVIRVHLCPFVVSLQRVTLFFFVGIVGNCWEILGNVGNFNHLRRNHHNHLQPSSLEPRTHETGFASGPGASERLRRAPAKQAVPATRSTHPASPAHLAANTHLIPSVSPAHRRDSKSDVSLPGELRLCQRSSQDKDNASPFVVKLFINYLCYQKAPESHNIAQIRVWQAPKARNIGRTMPIG